jgi:tripartite-type tricarboxylate transporter receptor subunit TctC
MRSLIAVSVLVLSSALVTAHAQGYPRRPVRLIVPQAPGSSSDTLARVVAADLSRQLGQQVIVDNRAGGALMIGMELVARAVPDGYTIGYAPIGALAISPHLVRKVPFDVNKDFQPIAQTANGTMLLAASPASPFRSVRDVIEYAKQNPGKLSNASSGNGTPGHVGFELFKVMTATQIVHVPYKGGAAAISDLATGQVQLMLEGMNSITPHAKSGRVRALAVSSARRSDALPDVPTMGQAGLGDFEERSWIGFFAPAKAPGDAVRRLNAEVNQALGLPDVRERFNALGLTAHPGTAAEFSEYVRAEVARWSKIVKSTGISLDQ